MPSSRRWCRWRCPPSWPSSHWPPVSRPPFPRCEVPNCSRSPPPPPLSPWADREGVSRGKRVSAGAFLAEAEGGFPQCDVLFGWDIQDEVIGSLPYSNWEIGFGDTVLRPDPSPPPVAPLGVGG